MKEIASIIFVSVVALFVLFVVFVGFPTYKCTAEWGDRGEFVPLAGCIVNTPNGRVPAKALRSLQ